jgi:hypothetical protein
LKIRSLALIAGLIAVTSLSVSAKNKSAKKEPALDPYQTILEDKYFLSEECDKYLAGYDSAAQAKIKKISEPIVAEDLLIFVSSDRLSSTKDLQKTFNEKNIAFNTSLINGYNKLKDRKYHRDFSMLYSDDIYNYKAAQEAGVSFGFIGNKTQPANAMAAFNFITCTLSSAAAGKGRFANYTEQYVDYVLARPEKAAIGYFEVSADKAYATNKVGTGNQFIEPKNWEGSRFFIVNASFKNLDTESRLPFGGSLYINYNGKDYVFDTVEPIMLEGYNIWFRSVNPLITMKTKIVYRIPNEIEGEVFWRPGRNSSDTRLWVGRVSAAK